MLWKYSEKLTNEQKLAGSKYCEKITKLFTLKLLGNVIKLYRNWHLELLWNSSKSALKPLWKHCWNCKVITFFLKCSKTALKLLWKAFPTATKRLGNNHLKKPKKKKKKKKKKKGTETALNRLWTALGQCWKTKPVSNRWSQTVLKM